MVTAQRSGGMASFCVVLLHLIIAVTSTAAVSSDDYYYQEEKLELAKLTYRSATYDKYRVPVRNHSQAIEVYVGLAVGSILGVDAFTETVSANIWVRLYWKDEYIQWDPADFNGTRYQTMNREEIWAPDLMLYNRAGGKGAPVSSLREVRVVVNNEGNVTCLFPAVAQVICTINVMYFPFDTEFCNIELVSMTYDKRELDLRLKPSNPADSGDFQQSSEWFLVNFTASQEITLIDNSIHGNNSSEFPINIFQLVLRRYGSLHSCYVIVPILLIHTISIMQFVVPCESREKVSIGFTINLSMGFFLVMVRETFPAAEYIAVCVEYIFMTLLLQGLAQIITIFVLTIHHSGRIDNHHQLPRWARVLLLHWMARILCLNRFITSDEEHTQRLRALSYSSIVIEGDPKPEPPQGNRRFEVHSSDEESESVISVAEADLAATDRIIPLEPKRTSSLPSGFGILSDDDYQSLRHSLVSPAVTDDEKPSTSTTDPTSSKSKEDEYCNVCNGQKAVPGHRADVPPLCCDVDNMDKVKHLIEKLRNEEETLKEGQPSRALYSVVPAGQKYSSSERCCKCRTHCIPAFMRCSYTVRDPKPCKCEVQQTLEDEEYNYVVCCCTCMKDIIAKKGWASALVPLKRQVRYENTKDTHPLDETVAKNCNDCGELNTIVVDKMYGYTRIFKKSMVQKSRHKEVWSEWKQASIVFDRLMFLIFLVSSAVVFFRLYIQLANHWNETWK